MGWIAEAQENYAVLQSLCMSSKHSKSVGMIYNQLEPLAKNNILQFENWDGTCAIASVLSRKSIDILNAVKEFYAMEAIVALLSDAAHNHFDEYKHSHAVWYQDFMELRNTYVDKLASAIYDYTAIVVAGELRHGYERATQYIVNYPNKGGRDSVYERCNQWSAESILRAGAYLFNPRNVEWHDGYGGVKWAAIADAGLCRSKYNSLIFVDHCVDLSHNNSVYFDKGAGIFSLNHKTRYANFLDAKRDLDAISLLNNEIDRMGLRLSAILKRAAVLGIFTEIKLKYADHEIEDAVLYYVPMVWGKEDLKLKLDKGRLGCNERRYSDDENDDRDDCECVPTYSFKVGDTVIVKKNLRLDESYWMANGLTSDGVNNKMIGFAGKEAIITKLGSNGKYGINLDNGSWNWTDGMFEHE